MFLSDDKIRLIKDASNRKDTKKVETLLAGFTSILDADCTAFKKLLQEAIFFQDEILATILINHQAFDILRHVDEAMVKDIVFHGRTWALSSLFDKGLLLSQEAHLSALESALSSHAKDNFSLLWERFKVTFSELLDEDGEVGFNLMMKALFTGCKEQFKLLFEEFGQKSHGGEDVFGHSLLSKTVEFHFDDLALYLIERLDINQFGKKALTEAVERNRVEVVKAIINKPGFSLKHLEVRGGFVSNITVFQLAQGKPQIVKLLKDKDIDLRLELKLEEISEECKQYRQHLYEAYGGQGALPSHLAPPKGQEGQVKIALKYNAVSQLLETLEDKNSPSSTRATQFQAAYHEHRPTIRKHRDGRAMQFLKNVGFVLGALCFLLGLQLSIHRKNTYAFWRSNGQVFSDKLDSVNLAPRA